MQFISIALIAVTGFTGERLDWSQHYGNARSIAGQKQQPLLVVLEDTTKSETKLDESALAANDQLDLLKEYKLCRIDVATEYGKRVAKSFHVDRFPYTVMIDKSSKYITFRHPGQMDEEEWKDELLAHKDIQIAPQVTTFKPVVESYRSIGTSMPAIESTIVQPQVISNEFRFENFAPVYKYQPPSNCPNCVRRPIYQ